MGKMDTELPLTRPSHSQGTMLTRQKKKNALFTRTTTDKEIDPVQWKRNDNTHPLSPKNLFLVLLALFLTATLFHFIPLLKSSYPSFFSTPFQSSSSSSRTVIDHHLPLLSKAARQRTHTPLPKMSTMRNTRKYFAWTSQSAHLIRSQHASTVCYFFYDSSTLPSSPLSPVTPDDQLTSFITLSHTQSKSDLLFISVEKAYLSDFASFLDDKTQLPSILVVEPDNNFRKYYAPLSPYIAPALFSSRLQQFLQDYLASLLSPWVRTTDSELHDGSSVWFITGEEFSKLVMDTVEDVVVFFYHPWCEHSQALLPRYVEAADRYVDVESILFFKFDLSKHDFVHPSLRLHSTPEIFFFPSGNKTSPIPMDVSLVSQMPSTAYAERVGVAPLALEHANNPLDRFVLRNIGYPVDEENTRQRQQKRLQRELKQ